MAALTTQTLDIRPQYYNPKLPAHTLSSSKKYEDSSDLVHLQHLPHPVRQVETIS
uniref:Uncharacterized protein n=1 Tax=Nelumbo nucifera TaxID=4432 RepID=A0A822Z2G2_NELNU|nr:TPA_asm: hypothetical protein HUJ06_008290 [Nelumbo nucifera]